jgi:hypothetical protein
MIDVDQKRTIGTALRAFAAPPPEVVDGPLNVLG